jgi:cytochrome c oxidase assembly protein subunit 15
MDNRVIVRLLRIEITLLFLVTMAGSIVRMTGSGMGCPDWPKCFGYYIPPTDRAQLEWQPNQGYERGQIIIHDEALWVAQSDFTSGATFDLAPFERYTRHDYAQFNVFHTWTEYINRLVGALSGVPMLLLFVLAWRQFRRDGTHALLMTAGLLLLGFEAWLGKVVVDANLAPVKITLHMLGAVALIALMLVALRRLNPRPYPALRGGWPGALVVLTLVLAAVQILLGTQVREQIDAISKSLGMQDRYLWISQLDYRFLLHRSFSWTLVAVAVWLGWKNPANIRVDRSFQWLVALLVGEVVLGIFLNYMSMPAWAQPAHLLMALLYFYHALNLWLRTRARGAGAL